MQYDMDVGGDAVPRRYLARVMAQPQRATVWGVRIRSGAPAPLVWTLWLETRALPHRARLSSSSPVPTMGRLLHLVTGPTRLGAFPTSMRKHPPEACTAGGKSSGARAVPETSIHVQAAMRRTTLQHPTAAIPKEIPHHAAPPLHTQRGTTLPLQSSLQRFAASTPQYVKLPRHSRQIAIA